MTIKKFKTKEELNKFLSENTLKQAEVFGLEVKFLGEEKEVKKKVVKKKTKKTK
jgi:hypothetical protein